MIPVGLKPTKAAASRRRGRSQGAVLEVSRVPEFSRKRARGRNPRLDLLWWAAQPRARCSWQRALAQPLSAAFRRSTAPARLRNAGQARHPCGLSRCECARRRSRLLARSFPRGHPSQRHFAAGCVSSGTLTLTFTFTFTLTFTFTGLDQFRPRGEPHRC